jgi:hypothetical protein
VNLLGGPVSHIASVDVAATALLLERVIQRAPDHDIWSAVYNLVTPTTPPPAPRVTVSGVADTPFALNSGALHSTKERRKDMDPVIRNDMKDSIYLDVPAFFATFFDSVDGLPHLVDAVLALCTSYTDANGWSAFPSSCSESNISTWFREEVDRIVEFALEASAGLGGVDAEALTSRRVVSLPATPLLGSTAPRKVDIGFAALNRADDTVDVSKWEEILVPGELKGNSSEDLWASTWFDLGRYVREVYNSQDTRRFCHGFTLCGDVMRVWRFDRGAIYSAPPFNVNEDGRKFVTVVLGYLLMGDEELGFDTTIVRDGDQRFVSVIRHDGGEERLQIEATMHRQACILGRATTCWRAKLPGGIQVTSESCIIKDSWQHEGKDDEGELLMEVTEAGVGKVAHCYHFETVRIGGRDDDLRSVRKGLNLPSGKKWKAPRAHAGSVLSLSGTGSSSSLRKRVGSTTLDSDRSQKRSRSNTQGDSNAPEDQAQNRVHKRVIMVVCGKRLHLTKTRIGLLRGLVDGITGTPIHS